MIYCIRSDEASMDSTCSSSSVNVYDLILPACICIFNCYCYVYSNLVYINCALTLYIIYICTNLLVVTYLFNFFTQSVKHTRYTSAYSLLLCFSLQIEHRDPHVIVDLIRVEFSSFPNYQRWGSRCRDTIVLLRHF